MRIDRRFLYAGTFLVAVGGVLVAADLVPLDGDQLVDVLRLWPLAIMALGVGIVLRRTPAAVPAGMLAAAMPGVLLGGAFAAAPGMEVDCGVGEPEGGIVRDGGSLASAATVRISGACGTFDVHTAQGSAWALAATNTEGRAPVVRATDAALSIESAERDEGWSFLHSGRDDWDVTLPTSAIDDLALAVSAGTGRFSLPGADIGRLDVAVNAASADVDLTDAAIDTLETSVNAGTLSLVLPARADLAASIQLGLGEIQLCAPEDLGLQVTIDGTAGEVTIAGEREDGSVWRSANYASAAHRADVTIDASFGEVQINPIGGCR